MDHKQWFTRWIPILAILIVMIGLAVPAVAEEQVTSVILNLPGENEDNNAPYEIVAVQDNTQVVYSNAGQVLGMIPNTTLTAALGNSALVMTDSTWFGGFSAEGDNSQVGFHRAVCGQNPNPVQPAASGTVSSDPRYGIVAEARWGSDASNGVSDLVVNGVVFPFDTGSWNTSVVTAFWTYIVDGAGTIVPTTVFVLDATLAEVDNATSPGAFFVVNDGNVATHKGNVWDQVIGMIGSSGLIGHYSMWSGGLDTEGTGISFHRSECNSPPPPPTCYSLSTSVNPLNSGTVSVTVPNCNGDKYLTGTVVTLTATAQTNWQFVNWTGDVSSSSIQTPIVMDSNKNVVANFAQVPPPASPSIVHLPLICVGLDCTDFRVITQDITNGYVQDGRIGCGGVVQLKVTWSNATSAWVQITDVQQGNIIAIDTNTSTKGFVVLDVNTNGRCGNDILVQVQEAGDGCNKGVTRHIDPIDSDGDGVFDHEDEFPLDPTRH